MTRISKKPKRAVSPHPKITALILAIQHGAEDELASILAAVQVWHWPRTDLHYWIKPLNRFDAILEEICKSYGLVGGQVQVSEFTPRTKELVLAILRFTRLLLENATNRKLYSSFDRLNDLLLTQDLDILESILRLIFRRAQQIASSGQTHSSDHFHLSTDRVRDLTTGWKAVRQAGLTMSDWIHEDLGHKPFPKTVAEVTHHFYRKSTDVVGSNAPAGASVGSASTAPAPSASAPSASGAPTSSAPSASAPAASVSTPRSAMRPSRSSHHVPTTPSSRSVRDASAQDGQTAGSGTAAAAAAAKDSEGLTVINLGNMAQSSKSATEELADAVDAHRIPNTERISLLQRIRVAKAVSDVEKRRQMLRVRLLAVSLLVHTSSDSYAESTIFLYEPDFIAQVADLVHPEHPAPLTIRTVALLTLDTVSRVRNKVGEVTSALSVSVNHGTLMSILRRLHSDLQSGSYEANSEYIDALFNFLMHLQTTGFAGNMLLGAGIIPLLIDLVKENSGTPETLLAANRAVTFLDNFTYSFTVAAGPFATAGGLTVFVERVKELVDSGVRLDEGRSGMQIEGNDAGDVQLSYPELTLLKSLFRCLQRLMGSSSNTEGVRNLIDSSLVNSCRHVMQHRRAYGPQNLALAINIMLTFVHNEPTSLTVLQEGKIPEAFYDAVLNGELEPSLDVLSAIPTAIGALCLNEAGLKDFIDKHLNIIDRFFEIFHSDKHIRVLNERENAVVIGANFDELVRHHPDLKQPVFGAITKLLNALYENGKDFKPKNPDGYLLARVDTEAGKAQAQNLAQAQKAEAEDQDVSMTGDASDAATADARAAAGDQSMQSSGESESKRDDNPMLTSIVITARFLEGFFSTPNHCKDYVKKEGLDALVRLYLLPCLPYDQVHHSHYPGITTVFMTINEHTPGPLLKSLLIHTKEAMDNVRPFITASDPEKASALGDGNAPFDEAALREKTLEMLSPSTQAEADSSNGIFRGLVSLQILVSILSEVYSMDSYMSRQPTSQLLSALKAADELRGIHELWAIHRVCVLTNVRFKGILPHTFGSKAHSKSGPTPLPTPSLTAASAAAPPALAASENAANSEVEMAQAVESSHSVGLGATGEESVSGATPAASQPVEAAASSSTDLPWPEAKVNNGKALKLVFGSIPDTLKSFFQGIMMLQVARRSSIDAAARKDATFVANAIAVGLAKSLSWPNTPLYGVNFEYSTIMAKTVSDLLLSDRASVGGLQLIFLKALDKQEGIDRLISNFRRYAGEVARLTDIPEAEREGSDRMKLIHAIGGLKVVLGLFETLISDKSLLTPGFLIMLTQDPKSPSYFDPHAFLVKLRARILPAVNELWTADYLAQCPPIIVRAVFRIILNILKANGEESDPSSTSMSSSTTTATPFPAGLNFRQQLQPNQTHVASLMEMGFPRSACEQALVRRGNNVQTAADYLMSHPEVVATARVRDAAHEAASAAVAAAASTSETTAESAASATAGASEGTGFGPSTGTSASASAGTQGQDDNDAPETSTATSNAGAASSSTLGPSASGDTDMASADQGAGDRATPLPPPLSDELPPASDATMSTEGKGKESIRKYSLADLNAHREPIQKSFIDRALVLARDHGELVFDIRDALKSLNWRLATGLGDANGCIPPMLEKLGEILREDIEPPEVDRGVAARVRLIALIYADTDFKKTTETAISGVMTIVESLARRYVNKRYDADARPKWLAPVMLLGELIFAKTELPCDPRGEPTSLDHYASPAAYGKADKPIMRGPEFTEQRRLLFDVCMDVLHKGFKEKADFQSAMRLILFLTRRAEFAQNFVSQGGLPALMSTYDSGRRDAENFQQYAIMILRHAVESTPLLHDIMSQNVERWLSTARRKNDVDTYVRDLNASAFRDAPLFMDVTQEMVWMRTIAGRDVLEKRGNTEAKKDQLQQQQQNDDDEDGSAATPKPVIKPEGAAGEGADGGSAAATEGDKAMQIDDLTKALPASSSSDDRTGVEAVMHFLLNEACTATQAVLLSPDTPDKAQQQAAAADASVATIDNKETTSNATAAAGVTGDATSATPTANSAAPDTSAAASSVQQSVRDFNYAAFLLTCLAELASAYLPCKLAVLNFTRRRHESYTGASSTTAAGHTPGPLATPTPTAIASKSSGGASSSRPRAHFLTYLLSEVLPTGELAATTRAYSRKRFALSSQAMTLIAAMCTDPGAGSSNQQRAAGSDKKDEPAAEVTATRKQIVDAVAKSLRDATASNEPINSKYARLARLGGLIQKFASPPAPVGGQGQWKESDLGLQMSRLMLERNFPALMTAALAEVDLNYPYVQLLINAILSPLEDLAKLATKLGRAMGDSNPTFSNEAVAAETSGNAGTAAASTTAPSGTADRDPFVTDSIAAATATAQASGGLATLEENMSMSESSEGYSDDDLDHPHHRHHRGHSHIDDDHEHAMGGEEVYRNSALGMFEGELEPANAEEQYMSGDEMEGDGEDWGDEDEEMMEEEAVVPSDVSDDSEDEDEEMAMAHEMREAMDEVEGMDDSTDGLSEDDDDNEGHDEDDDDDVDGDEDDDYGDVDDDGDRIAIIAPGDNDDDEDAREMRADLDAALANGHLEPVDDFTGQLIGRHMDLINPDVEGMIADGWQDAAENLTDVEGEEERDEDDDETDEDDDDDGGVDGAVDEDDALGGGATQGNQLGGAPGTIDFADVFRDILGDHQQGDVQVSLLGGPAGAEQAIVSIDVGAPGPQLTTGRRSARPAVTGGGVSQHSLLVDPTESNRSRSGRDHPFSSGRHRHGRSTAAGAGMGGGRGGSEYNEWVQSLEDLIGNGAGQLLQQVFGNIQAPGGGAGAPPPAVVGPPGGAVGAGPLAMLQNLLHSTEARIERATAGGGGAARHHPSGRRAYQGDILDPPTWAIAGGHPPHSGHPFAPMRIQGASNGLPGAGATESQLLSEAMNNPPLVLSSTVERWNEESAIFSGGMPASERVSLWVKWVHAKLQPDKVAREEKEAEEARKQQEAEREAAEEVMERAAAHLANAPSTSNYYGLDALSTAQSSEGASGAEGTRQSNDQAMEGVTSTSGGQPAASSRTQAQSASTTTTTTTTETGGSAATTTSGSGTSGEANRPSWRERVQRRREAQAAAQGGQQIQSAATSVDATTAGQPQQEQGGQSTSASGDGPNEASRRDPLTEVLNLAARLSAVDAASASGPSTPVAGAGANSTTSTNADAVMSEAAPITSTDDETAQQPTDVIEPSTEGSATAGESQDTVMEQTSEEQPSTEAGSGEAGPSTVPDRVMIEIRGSMVDITDTGIDPTFLEALPDDMREEVLNQHFNENRAARAPQAQEISSSINAEFLDALPPELRAEVLAQEALERARQQREQAAATAAAAAATGPTQAAATPSVSGANAGATATTQQGGPLAEALARVPGLGVVGRAGGPLGPTPAGAAGPAILEIDPATFLASLDPQLRQTVLLEQGEEMLGALPPDLLAEYEMLRARELRHSRMARLGAGGPSSSAARLAARMLRSSSSQQDGGGGSKKHNNGGQRREALQLLDRSGVATLVRLLFFPPPLKKGVLQNILINLCENSKTRVEVINLLLTILYEGTKESSPGTSAGGAAAVDRTLANLTSKNSGSSNNTASNNVAGSATTPRSARQPSRANSTNQVPTTPHSGGGGSSTQGAPQTPAALAGSAGISSMMGSGAGDNVPHLVVQRSLEALHGLVSASYGSTVYMTTLHDLPINLSNDSTSNGRSAPSNVKGSAALATPSSSRKDKGKGKEREKDKDAAASASNGGQQTSRTYPVVVLLSLLDRENITKTTSTMEALVKLLAASTTLLHYVTPSVLRPASPAAGAITQAEGGAAASSSTAAHAAADNNSNEGFPLNWTGSTVNAEVQRYLRVAPKIPASFLKMVVKILDQGECSSRMFTYAIAVIQNLTHLPGARDVLSSELINLAQRYGRELISDLGELQGVLDRGETAVSSSTLGKFSQASSKQAKILRVLKTFESSLYEGKDEGATQSTPAAATVGVTASEGTSNDVAMAEGEVGGVRATTSSSTAGPSTSAAGTNDGNTSTADNLASTSDQQSGGVAASNVSNAHAGGTAGKPTQQQAVAAASAASSSLPRNKVDRLYDGFDFSPLWTKLSDCLDVIERREDISNAGTLLPLIEAFLLVSSWGLENPDGTSGTAGMPRSPSY